MINDVLFITILASCEDMTISILHISLINVSSLMLEAKLFENRKSSKKNVEELLVIEMSVDLSN